jgi:anionic cell wall polymer biosynthesis LytR-Cps2A-Psr (LCP) family protein
VSDRLSVLPRLHRRGAARAGRRTGIALAALLAVGGAASLVAAVRSTVASIGEVTAVDGVLTPPGGPVENYLLVGSDSREGADPDAPDAGAIGGTADASGQRSDTVMVLRYDHASGDVSLLSLPRDLWVDIPGYGAERINTAYSKGADVLVRTVQQDLGLPVHHYLEVDFFGFKDIVDAVGGSRSASTPRCATRTPVSTCPNPGATGSTACRRWPTPAAATTSDTWT